MYGGREFQWDQLAYLTKVNLPPWAEEATPMALWWWITRLGIDPDDYLASTGYERPESMIAHNPGRPLRAYVGEMLEQFETTLSASSEEEAQGLADTDEMLAAPAVPGLKTDFADAGWWEHIAEELGASLPPWDEPLSEPLMKELLRDVKVSLRNYQQTTGDLEIMVFHWRNPRWPARAWYGLQLELVYEGRLAWRTEKPEPAKVGKR